MTPRLDYRGQSLIVTGASRGIGRAICLALAPHAPRLVLVARRSRDLEGLADEIRTLGADPVVVSADLADEAQLDGVVAAASATPHGGLAGLIHCAGVCELGSVEITTAEALDANWRVNLRAPFLLTGRLLPALRRGRGHVVFINSGAGRAARAGWGAYAASKHGLKALADALREEVAEDGVRVTSVYPGRTATDMQAAVHAHEGRTYDPQRFVRPEDVARTTVEVLMTAPPSVVEDVSIRPLP